MTSTTGGRRRPRTVSNLTEEQIQHKRNIDRRAQRAFRQRTKDSISALEHQYIELKENSEQREVQLQQKIKKLQRQNKALVACLENVLDVTSATYNDLQNEIENENETGDDIDDADAEIEDSDRDDDLESHEHEMGGQGEEIEELPSVTRSHSQALQPDGQQHVNTSPEMRQVTMAENSHSPENQRSPQNSSHNFSHESHMVPNSIDPQDPLANAGIVEQNVNVSPLVHHIVPIDATDHHHQQFMTSPGAIVMPNTAQSESMGIFPTPSSTATADAPWLNTTKTSYPSSVYGVMPSHSRATCPLDLILLNFLSSRTEMLSSGLSHDVVVGPVKPSVKAMLHTELSPSVHPLSAVMSEVLSTFPGVGIPEKLAFFFLMHQTMRWQIIRSKESYLFMPTWLRPTVTQITIPHAAWIDNIPWPGIRDILIENPEDYPFEVFSEYYSQNVTVSWKFDALDAISEVDNEAFIHSIFEKHIRNLSNWTVSSIFLERFPSMTSSIYARN